MKRKQAYSILVVEDEPLIRENLVKKLRGSCPEFEVVGEAADGREAQEMAAELHPDVLLTDIRMPVLDGIGLIRELYYSHPDMKVIILSGYDEFSYARSAIEFGVKDYLLKPVSAEDLRAALSRLAVQMDAEQERFDADHADLPEVRAQDELVGGVLEYLRARFSAGISLGEMAARFHVNPPYLTRCFKRRMGVAPARYLRDLRINHARKLLDERRDMEVKEVGAASGYPDPGYFSRIFRQAVGMSPQEYRERRGGGPA
jgi:two-component system, response regulator YesN